jgi:WD40 repeat protein/serine/threonine protein kinase
MTDAVGRQFGNYRLLRLLGQGGFADVYLGEHIYLRTQAAIKLLQTRMTQDDLNTFLGEARTVSSLIHPHIIRVLEFGVEGTTPFLVMDYAPNGTLRQRHPKGTRLTPPAIVPYVRQVASALQYAHDRKFIHRDVKPENMLLGQNNEILLSDFGIALAAQSSRYQSTQEVAGTLAYMAPEQLNGRPVPASDQYALGIIVFEWLTGERPFHGSFAEIASQHMLSIPSLLKEKIPEITPDIDEVVHRALAKDPQQRFARVEAFAVAFEQAVQPLRPLAPFILPSPNPPGPQPFGNNVPGLSSPDFRANQPVQPPFPGSRPGQPSQPLMGSNIPAPPPPPDFGANRAGEAPRPPYSMGNLQQQGQPFPPVGNQSMPSAPNYPAGPMRQPSGTTFVVPPGQGGPPGYADNTSPGAPSPHEPKPPRRSISRRAVVIGLAGVAGVTILGGGALFALSQKQTGTAGNTATPTANKGSTPTTAPTAGATDTSTPGSGSENSTPTASSTPFAAPGTISYNGHSRYVTAIAWSPNGTQIVSASGDNTVQVWDAATGNSLYTYSGHKNPVNAVVWSHDGQYIYSASDDVQVWQATNGTKQFTYPGHTQTVRTLGLSPDGKRMASGSDDSTIQIWDAATGSHFIDHNAQTGVRALSWSPDGKHIVSTKYDQVEVWDSTTGNTLSTYNGHSGHNVNTVAWSGDGKHVASGSDDKTVQVWDAFSLSPSYTFPGHSQPVYDVAWSPDSRRIASSGADTTVQVWNSNNGTNRIVYHGHNSPVNTVMWSPNGSHIASGSGDPNVSDGSDDHSAQIWQPS